MNLDLMKIPGRVPQRGLIRALILIGKSGEDIIATCRDFGYGCSREDVTVTARAILDIAGANVKKLIEDKQPLRADDPGHRQWLEVFGVREMVEFMADKARVDPPDFFKWVRDAIWINAMAEVQIVVNTLMYNGDDDQSIASVLRFKYKMTISAEALRIHREIFFDAKDLSADIVIANCMRMHGSTLVLREISGETGMRRGYAEVDGGQNRHFVFHNSEYLKWKLGYPELKPPRAEDFLNKVMTDAEFRYYEASQMTQFAKRKKEEGLSAVTGENYNNEVTQYDNVATEQAKLLNHYANMYVRALRAKPVSRSSAAEDLIAKLTRIEIEFDNKHEHIVAESMLSPGDRELLQAARAIGGDHAMGQTLEEDIGETPPGLEIEDLGSDLESV